VTVKEECGTDLAAAHPALKLSQTRFLPLGTTSVQPQAWQVPVCVVWSDGANRHRQCELLTKPSDTFPLHEAKACPVWLSANANVAGYYVDTYESPTAESLIHEGVRELSAAERAALLRSTRLLFSSGLGHLQHELALVSEFGHSSDAGLVRQSAGIVESLRRFVPPDLQARYGEGFVSFTKQKHATWAGDLSRAKRRKYGWYG
jgi:cytosol alanyl aminopeptidase